MSPLIFVCIFGMVVTSTFGLETFAVDTKIHECINCLCHARTGCWSRFNCAKYSVDYDYWVQAGSPTLSPDDDPNSEDSYERCMLVEKCIITTIVKYTESFGDLDCNCDGTFDCKDRLAVHLFGKNCFNPVYGKAYARRFNQCAKQLGVPEMLSSEGDDNCQPEPF